MKIHIIKYKVDLNIGLEILTAAPFNLLWGSGSYAYRLLMTFCPHSLFLAIAWFSDKQ
jgi:hypothetical protein